MSFSVCSLFVYFVYHSNIFAHESCQTCCLFQLTRSILLQYISLPANQYKIPVVCCVPKHTTKCLPRPPIKNTRQRSRQRAIVLCAFCRAHGKALCREPIFHTMNIFQIIIEITAPPRHGRMLPPRHGQQQAVRVGRRKFGEWRHAAIVLLLASGRIWICRGGRGGVELVVTFIRKSQDKLINL